MHSPPLAIRWCPIPLPKAVAARTWGGRTYRENCARAGTPSLWALGKWQNQRRDPQGRVLANSTKQAPSECARACAVRYTDLCLLCRSVVKELSNLILFQENKNTWVLNGVVCKGLTMGDLITLWAFPQCLLTWLNNKKQFMRTSWENQSSSLSSSSSCSVKVGKSFLWEVHRTQITMGWELWCWNGSEIN